MIRLMRQFNITSDMAYFAAMASIVGSIAMWFFRRGEDHSQAERFGIFIGLWAPTLAILGRALEENERSIKVNA